MENRLQISVGREEYLNGELAERYGEYSYEGSEELRVVEDDCYLHIEVYGKRYAVWLGENLSEQRRRGNQVLRDFGISGYRIQGS